jgi:hypothetical protein
VRVFISYHTPDLDKARAVEAALAARRPGTECYLAPRNMTAGAYWMPALAEAIARADAVLFLAGARIARGRSWNTRKLCICRSKPGAGLGSCRSSWRLKRRVFRSLLSCIRFLPPIRRRPNTSPR